MSPFCRNLLCFAIVLPFSCIAKEESLSLCLNRLAQHHDLPLVYDHSKLADVYVDCELSTDDSIENAFAHWLTPLGLRWRQTEVGLVIDTVEPLQRQNEQATQATIEEVTVVADPVRNGSIQRFQHNYQQAAEYARKNKQNAVGEQASLVGAMLTQLPAENLAEALQVVPGVSVTRDRGEALNINAMGLGAEYQMVLLNGRRVANTENVRNSNQYGQQFRFDTLSSGLFSNVSVYKTSDARLPLGGIGANIDLKSTRPLEFEHSAMNIGLDVAALEGDRNFQPNISMSANTMSADRAVAGVFKVSYENRLQRQYQFESWHWGENQGATIDYHWPALPDSTLVPTDGLALTIENEDRTRTSGLAEMSWQLNDHVQLDGLWFHSNTDFAFDEHRLAINPQSAHGQAAVDESSGQIKQLSFSNVDAKTSREESQLNYINQTTQLTATLDMKAWQFSPFFSHSAATSITKKPISRVHVKLAPGNALVEFQGSAINRFQFSHSLGLVESYNQISQMRKRLTEVRNRVDEWGLDSRWQATEQARAWWVELGFLHSKQRHQYQRQDVSLSASSLNALPSLDGRWLEPLPEAFDAKFISNTPYWLIPKRDLFQLFDIALPFSDKTESDLLNSYEVSFESIESYFTSNWHYAELEWQVGARYSDTRSAALGTRIGDSGGLRADEQEQRYVKWLPSVNVKWQASAHWQWRSTYSWALNRPNYSDMNPKLHVNSGGLPYAEQGNPALKPVLGKSYTLSLTHSAEATDIQVLVFQHEIDDFIVEDVTTLDYQGQSFSVLQKNNSGQGHITGFTSSIEWQLPALTQVWRQNRLSANVTQLVEADVYTEFNERFNLEGVSDWMGNVRFLTGNEVWQFAFNLNYRSAFLEHRDRSNNADIWVDAFTSLDLGLLWQLSPRFSVRFDVFNTTNQVLRRLAVADHASSLMKVEEFGRRFMVGLEFSL